MPSDLVVQEVKRAPVLSFVPRIRGARDVVKLTAAGFQQRAQSFRAKPDPSFTLQEYMKGDTEVHPYLDWDCKYGEVLKDELAEAEEKKQLADFQAIVTRLFPTAARVVYAQRHGVIGDPGDETREWKWKVSYRAWVLGIKTTVEKLPVYIRRVLGMGAKDNHSHLDLSVYKSKEQLLGVVYSCKDIDKVPRYLTPLDKTESLENFLAQNVSEEDVPLAMSEGSLVAGLGSGKAGGGASKPKTEKKKKSAKNDNKGEGSLESIESLEVAEEAVETLSGAKYASVFGTATKYFGKQYRMQEKLRVVQVNRKDKYLVFPTTKKWCFIKEDEHAGNNPYIVITDRGSRWKCFDEECKKAGEVKLIPFAELPKELRDLYAETFYGAIDNGLMTEAKVECCKNIVDNFPEESADSLDVMRYSNMLTTLAKTQTCKKCKSGKMQFEHHFKGWQLTCNDCQHRWPTTAVPIEEVDFPKLCAVLTQLNIGTLNITNNNITNNIYNGTQVDFYADFSGDDLIVFHADEKMNGLFIGALQGTDNTLSLFATEYFKDRFHCTDERLWYEFAGHCWSDRSADLAYKEALCEATFLGYFRQVALYYEQLPLQNDEIKRKARMVRKLCVALEDGKQRDKVVTDSIMKFHKRRPKFADELNTQNIMVFEDGVFDFEKFTFGPGNPDVAITMCVPQPFVPYDPDDEKTKLLVRFMEDILPNEAVRTYTLMVLGLCLTLDTSQQYFWIFSGSGSNGKGRLMSLLEECLGPYHQAISPALITRKREEASSANEALMSLRSVRLAVFQEPESGEIVQAGTIKTLTGEDTLSTRQNYGHQVKFRPKFKSIMVCNEMPKISETNLAVTRRIRCVHFPTSFVENPTQPHERKIDVGLDKKLKAASSHFIGILVHYYQLYLRVGLQVPDDVLAFTKKYQDDSDIVQIFLQEHLERRLTDGVPSRQCAVEQQTAVNRFKTWYRGEKRTVAPKTMVEKLKEALGTVTDTTLCRETWISLTGYQPPEGKGTEKRVKLYGYYGWAWIRD